MASRGMFREIKRLTYPVIKYVCGRNYIMSFHKHPLGAVLICLCENMHPQHEEKDVEKIIFRVEHKFSKTS